MRYRRAKVPGGTYFFTVNLAERKRTLLVDHIDDLRNAVRKVLNDHPFRIDAMVVLPDHLHAVWKLPEGDADYSMRRALIKAGFLRCIPAIPRWSVGFDKSPRKLTEALGATVDSYSLEYQCCGGAGGFSKTSPAEADAFTKTKLDAIINETKAEFIVVSCITCLMYMDNIQEKLNKQAGKEIYNIPVFDYNQLLALCMGFDGHKVAAISKIPRESILRRF